MVRTKQHVAQHYTEEILVESSSSEEEMTMTPIDGNSEEVSMVEDTVEEEALHRWGRKHTEGQVSSQKTIFIF